MVQALTFQVTLLLIFREVEQYLYIITIISVWVSKIKVSCAQHLISRNDLVY